jgi:hypothetical protein
MENLSVSSQIKEFSKTWSTAIAPIRIGSIRIKTIPRMTEEEIKKGEGNRNVGRTLGPHEKEVGAKPDQHGRKTSRRSRKFRGDSEEEESLTQHGRHMQGSYRISRYTRCINLQSPKNETHK